MNKKNILTAAVSLSLVACLSIGATLAYFTDKTQTAENVLTTGNINVKLIDRTEGPDEEDTWLADDPQDDTGITYTHVMPGDEISKLVGLGVEEGSESCYMAMSVSISHNNGLDMEDIYEDIRAQAIANGWLCMDAPNGDLYCFYSEKVNGTVPMSLVTLFDTVNVPESWTDEYANTTFNIDVKGVAIQAANLEAPNEALNNTTCNELSNMLQQVALG